MMSDVLILSSSIGSGHMRASQALRRGAQLVDPGSLFYTVDYPREISPTIEHTLRGAYLESLKFWPRAYGRLYRSTGHSGAGIYSRYLGGAGLGALRRLVAEYEPRALVATHFYAAGMLEAYKKERPDVFTAVVVTDFVPHPIGMPHNADLYLVANEEAAATVESLGVPRRRIQATGIPIDPAFEETADAGAARIEIIGTAEKDDDLPVVLVMGGGLGSGTLERVVSSLIEVSQAMHLVVLCGSNENARSRLEALARRRGHPTTLIGYTDQVREVMSASTLLVSKPGGLSCSEALASGLPQVLYHPIPGNEEENAQAIVRYGAGVLAESDREVLGEVLKILTSQKTRKRMTEAACAAHRPHSARAAARLILEGAG